MVLAAKPACPFMRMGGRRLVHHMNPRVVSTLQGQCPFLARNATQHGVRTLSTMASAQHQDTPRPNPHHSADKFVSTCLQNIRDEGRYRVFFDIERLAGNYPKALNHTPPRDPFLPDKDPEIPQPIDIWCNNDYLGMGQHPQVLDAIVQTTRAIGAGSGGTRNISGTSHLHSALERKLAQVSGKESALVFSSGYVANDTTLATLGSTLPNCEFYSDALNHASLIAGIRNSRAKKFIFRHNDTEHLRSLLQQGDPHAHKIIVFESVYSMDGDIAPIADICSLAEQFNALTFIDEVHAVGLYGASGGGVAEQLGLSDRVSMISGTLGKAYGCFGGFVAMSDKLRDYVRSFASGFIFTTSIPPYVCAGALKSVELLAGEQGRTLRRIHQEKAAEFKQMLVDLDLPVLCSESHIVPLMVYDPVKVKQACDMLLSRYGIYLQPINYPTVPKGLERVRITPSPVHSTDMMKHLAHALKDVWTELNISAPPCQ